MANQVITHPSLYSATGKRGRKPPDNIIQFPDLYRAYRDEMTEALYEMLSDVGNGHIYGFCYITLGSTPKKDLIGHTGLAAQECSTARVVYQLQRLALCKTMDENF